MKVGLIDVDGHNFPNLALMKISGWHKQQGDTVEWAHSLDTYDKVYMSKVFTFTPDYTSCIQADEIIRGGTGYDLENKLPAEIESMCPDFTLYKQYKEAYGFLTRGCPRNCQFCIVGEKEGYKSYKVADLEQFWTGQKEIKLLDPNLLACKSEKYNLLQQLVDSKAKVDFTQGLDVRLMDDKAINLIKQINLEIVHFAWDRDTQSDLIINNLKAFKEATGIDRRKAAVYVLTNYETEFEFDLYRVYRLRELGFDPYVMIYEKEKFIKDKKLKPMNVLLKKYTTEQIKHFKKCWKLQRWVNNKIIFQSCEKFEDYKAG